MIMHELRNMRMEERMDGTGLEQRSDLLLVLCQTLTLQILHIIENANLLHCLAFYAFSSLGVARFPHTNLLAEYWFRILNL